MGIPISRPLSVQKTDCHTHKADMRSPTCFQVLLLTYNQYRFLLVEMNPKYPQLLSYLLYF